MSHLSKLRYVIVILCLIACRAIGAAPASDPQIRYYVVWRRIISKRRVLMADILLMDCAGD